MIPYLPLLQINARHLTEIEEAVGTTLSGGCYLRGRQTARFEEAYARYTGTTQCVSCGNGLDALTLIFRAYRELGLLSDGDEVIVPANTYIASILALSANNLKPVLVEPDARTLQIDGSLIESAITKHTRAILIVHLYGRCAYTSAIGEVCNRHRLLLVEDNAQAHGCTFSGRRTGSLGHAAAHSFYPTKNLGALGDAGAVTTNSRELADVVRALGNYGSSEKYIFHYKGINSRMDEVQAAVLNVKLQYLDSDNLRRQEIAHYYYRNIRNEAVSLPAEASAQSVYHIFPILCPHRDALQRHLAELGIGTAIHYPIPPHKQAAYKEWHNRSLPVTEMIHQQELSIPCHPALTDDEAARIVQAINVFRP